ncbi:putative amino acid permease YhdG [Luteitalea pratensis]|uniref:Putative amino acid permease YhdG n=1 Tax=Luteitalea pratensis TaxID=1855912 RepID=A0A143PS53_LUTPR|nr:amino acid permease [Luteitalea pratensis]AMY10930.1 putative amino acid permease YhdG [Luteitalea pratensis]
MASSLFRTKSIDRLLAEGEATGEGTLKRTLNSGALIALGIGAIIGAGLFVRTAAAIADRAGPGVTVAFLVAALGCALAGLCYAEFASMIPIAGSAYTYSYATMGELAAWIIGWDLILEYAVGAATVAIAWSEYLNKVLEFVGLHVPYAWSHSPFQVDAATGVAGIINLPAVLILGLLTALLVRGTQESAWVNNLIVITKVSIVIMVIVLGWGFINPANHTPYIPAASLYTTPEGITHNYGGIMGILGAAGVVFFAYIGFDAVSTAAQEAKNPKRDMPIGILGSLVVCTILYVLFAHVLSGIATVEDFRSTGREASVAFAISKYMVGYDWLAKFVTVAILAGFSSVILVMLLGQSRVFYSMSHDGLVPKFFSHIHPKYHTPYKSNWFFFIFTALFAAFVPGDIVGEMTSIGTLFAFMLVCAGVWILRVRRPDIPRGFRVPAVPLVSTLGIFVCGAMVFGLGWTNWVRLGGWLVIGLVIYFGYSKQHSKLNTAA